MIFFSPILLYESEKSGWQQCEEFKDARFTQMVCPIHKWKDPWYVRVQFCLSI